jgi:regulator of protease activity HflC (stomatin/prohibitin superfamily)
MSFCCCCYSLQASEQAIFYGITDHSIEHGPKATAVFCPCISTIDVIPTLYCRQNEMVIIYNDKDPSMTRYEYGPGIVKLTDGWERYDCQGVQAQTVLDQDDYLLVQDLHGTVRVEKGPQVFRFKEYGEALVTLPNVSAEEMQSVQVPVNQYMIVFDREDTEEPYKHIRGPAKYYPEPFQTITKNKKTGTFYFPCEEITSSSAIHLQASTGKVILLDTPQFYMPKVGESVIKRVDRTILSPNDFCILKSPSGKMFVRNGKIPSDRSFFIAPYQEFVTFDNLGTKNQILSVLPQFLAHTFVVLTNDNVNLMLEIRISYQIRDVETFTQRAINFFDYIRSHVQNVLLDKFAGIQLREFMVKFSSVAQECIPECSDYFSNFGIDIRDIQILDYRCPNKDTQELLAQDIHSNVTKQNQLRAKQNDVAIQEEANKVQMKQKDLEVEMSLKENEVDLSKKELEVDIRIKEMDIEIQEELKRRELLDVKRENDLVEAEFEGRAKGHEIAEFLKGIDPKLTSTQKLKVWNRRQDLTQAEKLYTKVPPITLYPQGSNTKMYTMQGDLQLAETAGGAEIAGAVNNLASKV